MAMTTDDQQKAMSEGFALGLLMVGFNAISHDKPKVDSAYSMAVSKWEYRDLFPALKPYAKRTMDPYYFLTYADKRKRTFGLYWTNYDDGHMIATRDGSDIDDIDADSLASVIEGGIPANGWKHLAELFVEKMYMLGSASDESGA